MGRIHFFHLDTRNIIFSQQITKYNDNSNTPCFQAISFNTKKYLWLSIKYDITTNK